MSSNLFDGFPTAGIDFLAGLADNNSKDYFDANRKIYDSALIGPAKAFVEMMGEALRQRTGRDGVRAEPRVNGSIFRLNRDVRFSKDKTPYKDHLDFIFWEGEGKGRTCPSFYLRLTPTETVLGTGMIGFDKKKLPTFREVVADDDRGAALETAIAEARANAEAYGDVELRGTHYQKVPRGYAADHPRAALLKHAGVHLQYRDKTPPDVQDTVGFVDWCGARWQALDPLQHWLITHFDF
ncbi:MAG: DUF2461 domain-containing protein [Acidobacteriota bacterium]